MTSDLWRVLRSTRGGIAGGVVALVMTFLALLPLHGLAQVTAGASCGAVPGAYPVLAGSGSDLQFDSSPTMNSSSISGSGNAVGTNGARASASATLPALDPATFPSISSSANVSTSPVAPGSYSSVSVNSAGFTFTGGGT